MRDERTIIYILISVMILPIIYLIGLTFILIQLSSIDNQPQVIVIHVEAKTKEVEKVLPKQEVKTKTIIPKPEVKKVVPKKPEPKKVVNTPQPKVNDDAYLLAQIIHAEANSEPYNGKLAVGNVVMNRVKSDKFPDTVKGVIFQRGQFQPVSNGTIYNKPSPDALKAANEVMNGRNVVGNQALYFYNPDTSTSDWIFSRKTIANIGNHRFAY
jgi:N-acetylmuramoyl-L-alanine amidase